MVVLVGSNHRSAPVAVRERMSFPLEHLPEAHAALMGSDEVGEALILSTCNRVEVLARASRGAAEGLDAVKRFLAERHRLSLDEIDRYTYQLAGSDAVKHLFGVASGLDSMIMGEPQILGQVKQAYRTAKELGTLGPVLERLLQHCLAAAKKVRTETGISRNAVSVAFAAVELGRKIFGDLEGRRAMLLGAGKMGQLVGRHLVSSGVREMFVCSRNYTRAVVRAEETGGRALPWDEGLANLRNVDIVVSCTGAPHVVLTKKDVARSLRGRRKGPLFLIDIAVPRDVEPQVNELDDVYLYDIDGLQNVVDANLEERRRAAEQAKRMIAVEAAAFGRWQQSQEVAPLIVSLREGLLDVGRREIERFRRRLGGLDGDQQAAVEELTRAVIQKILHRPIRHLHHAAERGEVAGTTALYREIFGVPARAGDDGASPRSSDPDGPEPAGPHRILSGGKKG